eukprot:5431848-Pyramimonas_sp.AAC.1
MQGKAYSEVVGNRPQIRPWAPAKGRPSDGRPAVGIADVLSGTTVRGSAGIVLHPEHSVAVT